MQRWIVAFVLFLVVGCAPAARPATPAASSSVPGGLETTALQQQLAQATGVVYFKGPFLKSKVLLDTLVDLHNRGLRVIALFERTAPRATGSLLDNLANQLSGSRSVVLVASDATRIAPFLQASVGSFRGEGLVGDRGAIFTSTNASTNRSELGQFDTVARNPYAP
jgi:hypothetical protein